MGNATPGAAKYQTFTESVMGTVVQVTVASRRNDLDRATRLALAEARASLHRADAIFSVWRPNSPLSRLRRDEIEVDACPPEVAEVVALSRELRVVTDGWFDPWSIPGGFDPTGLVKGWAAARAMRSSSDRSPG
jgi:thiamine biosynthesis lipoprotein